MDETNPYGLSVDIGTTWITVHIVDIPMKHVISERVLENPQSVSGLDVVTRIKQSLKDQRSADWFTAVIRESVDEGIQEILSAAGIPPESVEAVVIVGNTVMHHMFYGLPVDSLVRPPYTAEGKSPVMTRAERIGLHLGEHVVCYSPPIVESFVGPDALAVLLASDILNRAGPSVVIDIGTNTEILLRTHGRLYAASAASGPAFEGMTIECGMPARNGAIFRVKIDRQDLRPLVKVIGNERPTGICGTGIVSALAEMLNAGIMNSIGSIERSIESVWLPKNAATTRYVLCQATETASGQPIYVSQPDVRLIQQSKAAINAAIGTVVEACDISPDEIRLVYLTGSFGSQLNLDDAYRIGLLPKFAKARVNQIRGGASIGADIMVSDSVARQEAEKAAKSIRYLELVDNAAFEIRYAQAQLFPTGD